MAISVASTESPEAAAFKSDFQIVLAALSASPGFVESVSTLLSQVVTLCEKILELPGSPGYEPLLIERGCRPVVARGLATLAVRHGRRRAGESREERRVFEAIRFLGRRRRQKRSIVRCARLLLQAWEETAIIETAFDEAGVSEVEFIRLLQSTANGADFDADRVTALAAAVAPSLTRRRGPKVSAPSAAHEFLLQNWPGKGAIRRPRSWPTPSPEWVDALTDATRREFGRSGFDSRPARRRLRAKRAAERRGL